MPPSPPRAVYAVPAMEENRRVVVDSGDVPPWVTTLELLPEDDFGSPVIKLSSLYEKRAGSMESIQMHFYPSVVTVLTQKKDLTQSCWCCSHIDDVQRKMLIVPRYRLIGVSIEETQKTGPWGCCCAKRVYEMDSKMISFSLLTHADVEAVGSSFLPSGAGCCPCGQVIKSSGSFLFTKQKLSVSLVLSSIPRADIFAYVYTNIWGREDGKQVAVDLHKLNLIGAEMNKNLLHPDKLCESKLGQPWRTEPPEDKAETSGSAVRVKKSSWPCIRSQEP